MQDKETGGYRSPTSEEAIKQDVRHAYEHPGSVFDVGGWEFRWWEWRTPANQFVEFGMWTARYRARNSVRVFYATTLGVTARLVNPEGVVDTTIKHKGFDFTQLTTGQKGDLAALAFDDLRRHVQGPTSTGD